MRPDQISPTFLLYTRSTVENPEELKIDEENTIRNAHVRPNGTAFFIIHGYLENGDKTWVGVSKFLIIHPVQIFYTAGHFLPFPEILSLQLRH